jgi:hypothetical protein
MNMRQRKEIFIELEHEAKLGSKGGEPTMVVSLWFVDFLEGSFLTLFRQQVVSLFYNDS